MVQVPERQREWMKAYRPLIGNYVEYTSRSGERHTGKLVDVQININTHEPEAFIRRWRTVLSFSKTTDIVPLALVLTRPPNWNKNWKNSSAYSFGEAHVPSKHSIYERDPEDFKLYGGTYKYGQRVYVAKLWPHFKVNSDVAWTPENGSQPFIGKVKYIGEYESSEGYPVIEAIVQFDQPTTHLPGYISRPPANRNLVHVSELQTLTSLISKSEDDPSAFSETQEGESSQCPVDYSLIDFGDDVGPEPDETFMSIIKSSTSTAPHPCAVTKPEEPFMPIFQASIPAQPAASINTANPFLSIAQSSAPLPLRATIKSEGHFMPIIKSTPPPPARVGTMPTSLLSLPTPTPTPKSSQKGIQGGPNSSYMDATLFSMFSYSTVFDEIITKVNEAECKTHVEKLLKTILLNSVVNPLRWECQVPPENTFQLRRILAENVSPKYLQDAADADEFFINLCKLMNIPELIEYNNGTKEYIHHVAVPSETGHFPVPYKCMQTLVEKSFSLSATKLTRRPRQAFIAKMPTSDGKLVGCDGVIPNFTLNLSPILSSNTVGTSPEERVMKLSAVICRKDKHFVTFVRSGQAEESSWIFMDPCGTAETPGPQIEVMEGLSKSIEACLDEAGFSGGELNLDDPGCSGFNLFKDAYMCIYT